MKIEMRSVTSMFGLLIVILIFTGVIAFGFTNFMADELFGIRRTVFIFILLSYGIYRSIRLYQVFKKTQHED